MKTLPGHMFPLLVLEDEVTGDGWLQFTEGKSTKGQRESENESEQTNDQTPASTSWLQNGTAALTNLRPTTAWSKNTWNVKEGRERLSKGDGKWPRMVHGAKELVLPHPRAQKET